MGFTLIIAMTKRKNNNSGMESLFAAIETTEPWFMAEQYKAPPIKPLEQIEREIAEMNAQRHTEPEPKKGWDCTEVVKTLRADGKKILTLPFDCKRIAMEEVLFNRKKETRLIYPSNRNRYMNEDCSPRHYDYLYLINGRDETKLAPTAPRALVKVEKAEIVELVDENDRPIWEHNPDGTRYQKLAIEYTLGDIVRCNNLKYR